MADMIPPIIVSIEGNTADFESKINGLDSKLNGLGDTTTRTKKPFDNLTSTLGALGLAFGMYQVVQFGKDLYAAAEAEQVSNARLENITESMGLFGAEAGNVSKRLEDLAQKTALNTGVDEDSIKLTQAKLMTFKELAASADEVGGQFDRATQAAIDMASAGFGEAESNAVQLGKALNDPIKGITALTRSGITFTDAEKEQIAAMVEHGNVGKAQEAILKAIETQVGGTAEATATGTGKMQQGWEYLQEQLGGPLLDAVNGSADVIVGMLTWIGDNLAVVGTFVGVLGGLAIALNIATIATWAQNTALWGMAAALLANPITWIVLAIAALAAGIVYLVTKTTFFQDAWANMCKWIADAWNKFGKWLGQSIMNIAKFFGDLPKNIVTFITKTIPAVWKWFTELPKKIVDFIVKAAPVIWKWFQGLPAQLVKSIGDIAKNFLKVGGDIINGILQGIKNTWNGVVNWLKNAVDNAVEGVKDWLGIASPSKVFSEIGANMALGMAMGIKNSTSNVVDAATDMAEGATARATVAISARSGVAASRYIPSGNVSNIRNASSNVNINAPVTVQTNASPQDVSRSIVNAIKFNLPYITTTRLA